jgi:hypothetical protein
MDPVVINNMLSTIYREKKTKQKERHQRTFNIEVIFQKVPIKNIRREPTACELSTYLYSIYSFNTSPRDPCLSSCSQDQIMICWYMFYLVYVYVCTYFTCIYCYHVSNKTIFYFIINIFIRNFVTGCLSNMFPLSKYYWNFSICFYLFVSFIFFLPVSPHT